MFTLNDEDLNAEAYELSDIEIMFEFIKLRELADKHLSASMRFASIEEKLNHSHYEDAFYKLADIYCTLKSLSALKPCELYTLRYLLKALEFKASIH